MIAIGHRINDHGSVMYFVNCHYPADNQQQQQICYKSEFCWETIESHFRDKDAICFATDKKGTFV